MNFEDHTEFLDFAIIKIPYYDAILGKVWLDLWNPVIKWQTNTMQWNMGKRIISVTRVLETQTAKRASSLFQSKGDSGGNFSPKNEKNCQKRTSILGSDQN